MTPDLPTRIQLVLAECERIIQQSNEATFGPWYAIQHPEYAGAKVRVTSDKTDEWGDFSQLAYCHKENAELIVSGRTFCPAAAVGIKEALEGLRLLGSETPATLSVILDRLTSPFAYLWETQNASSVSNEP